jgi:hypothetical protein
MLWLWTLRLGLPDESNQVLVVQPEEALPHQPVEHRFCFAFIEFSACVTAELLHVRQVNELAAALDGKNHECVVLGRCF